MIPSAPASSRRLRHRLALSLCAALAAPVPAQTPGAEAPSQPAPARASVLPSLGEAASSGLNAAEERRLGDEVMRQIRADPDYLDDPILLDYLQGQWRALLGAARRLGDVASDQEAHGAWEVFLLRDRSVNAFALPGGYVGVYLGMLALTTSPDQLASVLAHEMSHVTQRHIARMLGNQSRQGMVGLATMVLGVLAASRNPTAANALIIGGQAAAAQGQLNFSRDMEREADRVGYGVLSGAGYAGAGMAEMFEKLAQSSRLTDDQSYPWLRTHPLTTERIAEARSRAQSTPRPSGSMLLHAVMRARAQVLMDPRAQAWSRLAAAKDAPQASTAERLSTASAAALAAARLKDPVRADAAQALARRLAQGDAEATRALDWQGAELMIERGDARRSAAAVEQAGDDGSRTALWLGARSALLGGEADWRRSAEALQAKVAETPNDATMWALLASLAARLDQPLRAVRAEAESHLALGDLVGAIDRLQSGQRMARQREAQDSMDAAVIESRLRELRARRQQEEREGLKRR